MINERYLTPEWNNLLSLALGLPILGFVIFVLTSSVMSDFSSFIWLLVTGVIY